jgi:hypothetical protein
LRTCTHTLEDKRTQHTHTHTHTHTQTHTHNTLTHTDTPIHTQYYSRTLAHAQVINMFFQETVCGIDIRFKRYV